MKQHYDRWLVRHPRNHLRRTGNEVSGTKTTIVKTYWFKWPDADTFKQRLIELLACYPDGTMSNEDEESCEAIWEAVSGVIREQKSLSEKMIPPSVKAAFDAARQKRMAHPGYSESDSWRWGRVDGYACFVNNFTVSGVRNRVTEWSRDRLRRGHHYEGDIDSITALRVDVIARIAKTINPALEGEITRLVSSANGTLSDDVPNDEPEKNSSSGTPRALTDEQELAVVKGFRAKQSVTYLAKKFGVSRPTIDKILVKYGLKRPKKRSILLR